MTDALLHFSRMLGGGNHLNRPVFPGLRKGSIHLQVEVLLPPHGE